MGCIDVNGGSFSLPDGRPLLADLLFRVTDAATTALIGANGAGKSTLLRIIRGELRPDEGSVQVDGGLGVMDQFVGTVRTADGAAETVSGRPSRRSNTTASPGSAFATSPGASVSPTPPRPTTSATGRACSPRSRPTAVRNSRSSRAPSRACSSSARHPRPASRRLPTPFARVDS
ncbi:hypothetical protein GCM10023152_23230 [Agromyces bauzanensis]|uniref:ABC transporter domain-containing protein n=1 Tax=Agromyces bauzanensis TaxID=1308924 RepID=A0A917UQG2_9MICO|nr:hypothetical protein GCM10011372_12840 [Agromyces bauzanensis]